MAVRIMVVDDEPAIGKLLVYQLSGSGYHVSYVENGMLALERFLREQPDLILLDVMMPQISGWEVCQQIRACSSTPVIMLTAKNADLDVMTGLKSGADDYISKPFSMPMLQARIESVLRRSHVTQPKRDDSPEPAQRPLPTASQRLVHISAMEAYRRSVPPAPLKSQANFVAISQTAGKGLGQRIRETRIARGLSLQQVEQACRIRWEFLQAIEQENWSYVPRVQLRYCLRIYIRYLALDPHEVGTPHPFAVLKNWPLLVLWVALFAGLLALILYLTMV